MGEKIKGERTEKQLSRLRQACLEVMGVSNYSVSCAKKSAAKFAKTGKKRAWRAPGKEL